MKNAFVLVQIIFGCGFFAAGAAYLGGQFPFDLSSFRAALGGYVAAGVLALTISDYARGPFQRAQQPSPKPVRRPALSPQPRPVSPLAASGAAAWSCRTISA